MRLGGFEIKQQGVTTKLPFWDDDVRETLDEGGGLVVDVQVDVVRESSDDGGQVDEFGKEEDEDYEGSDGGANVDLVSSTLPSCMALEVAYENDSLGLSTSTGRAVDNEATDTDSDVSQESARIVSEFGDVEDATDPAQFSDSDDNGR